MKNYPKMLYQGNLQVFKTAIADNEDHESELKEQGWIEYGDLKEPKTESEGVAHGVGALALEGLNDIKQELADVTQERDELRTENERLSDIITKGSAENVELKESLSKSDSAHDKFRNDVAAMKTRIAELQGDTTPVGATKETEQKAIVLADLTIPQLQEMAKSKGVEFKARDSKDTLIELILNHDASKSTANQD